MLLGTLRLKSACNACAALPFFFQSFGLPQLISDPSSAIVPVSPLTLHIPLTLTAHGALSNCCAHVLSVSNRGAGVHCPLLVDASHGALKALSLFLRSAMVSYV